MQATVETKSEVQAGRSCAACASGANWQGLDDKRRVVVVQLMQHHTWGNALLADLVLCGGCYLKLLEAMVPGELGLTLVGMMAGNDLVALGVAALNVAELQTERASLQNELRELREVHRVAKAKPKQEPIVAPVFHDAPEPDMAGVRRRKVNGKGGVA